MHPERQWDHGNNTFIQVLENRDLKNSNVARVKKYFNQNKINNFNGKKKGNNKNKEKLP